MMPTVADIFDAEASSRNDCAAAAGNVLRFTVPGDPVAKGRPRIGMVHGHAMAFTPKETRTYESEIRHIANEAYGFRHPLDGVQMSIAVDVYRPIPKSLSNKKADLARRGSLRPTSRPDADNYLKSAVDGMCGVVFKDDSAIVEMVVRKWYADRPRLEVELRWT